MTEYIQVMTTTETREQAEAIADRMVRERLAACAQVLGPISSTYWWQGKVEQAQEFLCLLKSRQDRFADLEAAIRAVHPYQVPEILAVPVAAGSAAYLSWLAAELTGP
ncbi:MAG: divalent-cation tolerance protein CutA [Thermodesulfobacteriota bacterium]